MRMVRTHARYGGKHHRRHRRAERYVKHVLRRQPLRGESEHQQRHHDHAAADAQQPGGEADERAYAEIRGPRHHAASRCATTSANPAPELATLMYFGAVASSAPKRRTLATPTERGKNSNIGASFGESPTYTTDWRSPSRSMANSSRKRRRVIASLS